MDNGSGGGIAAMLGACIMLLIELGLVALILASMWKVFVKAGRPGWAGIIPIYNCIVMLEIIGRPLWWIVLLLIPFVNIVAGIIVCLDLAKKFGKGAGFGIGMAFLPFIFLPILGFGSAQFQGAAPPAGQR